MTLKSYGKKGVELVKTGIGLSSLASIDTTGTASKMASYLPTIGTIQAGKEVISTVKKLK